MDGNGETPIFDVMIRSHPIDSQPFINAWPLGVPGKGTTAILRFWGPVS